MRVEVERLFVLLLICFSSCVAGKVWVNITGDAELGEECLTESDCKNPDKVECKFELCWCRDGFVMGVREGQFEAECFELINEIGKQCEVPPQCQQGEPGRLSDCLPSESNPGQTVCNCTPDAINQPGEHKCYKRANALGESCEKNFQCYANLGETSVCTDEKKCSCADGLGIPSSDGKKCLSIRNKLEDECLESSQCKLGIPGSWSDCLVSESQPGKKSCRCLEEAINESGQHVCYEKRENVGETCEVDVQCSENLGELSECSSTNDCVCKDGLSVPSISNNKCLKIIHEIGGECTEAQQCRVGTPGDLSDCVRQEGSFPNKKVCNCTTDAINDPGKHQCLLKAGHINDPCEVDVQCTASLGTHSHCDKNKCSCISGAVPGNNNTRCVLGSVLIGRPCFDSAQCVGDPEISSECTPTGICSCRSNHVPKVDFTDCLPICNQIGETCKESQQCLQGKPGPFSDCMSSESNPNLKVCNCTHDATHERGEHRCHLKAEHIGDPCEVNAQCKETLGYLSECSAVTKMCTCTSRAVSSGEEKSCLRIVDSIAGECKESIQCQAGHPGQWSACLEVSQCKDSSPGASIPDTIPVTLCRCIPGLSELSDDETFCVPNRQWLSRFTN